MSKFHNIANCGYVDRKVDVIFVHGLGGHAFTTWRYGEGIDTSWPHWLGEEFPKAGVWSLGYAVDPSRWPRICNFFCRGNRDRGHSMGLPDRAGQVLDLMIQQGFGQRPLVFIGHSLGGLLIKQVLRMSKDSTQEDRKSIFSSTRAVLFLSTPHSGADLASLIDGFRKIFRRTIAIEDLRSHDPHLRDLYEWYRSHAVPPNIQTQTYYETRSLYGFIIVDPTSAHPGIGSRPTPLDEDHLSIAKPLDRDAQVCKALYNILQEYIFEISPALSLLYVPKQEFVNRIEATEFQRSVGLIPCQLPPLASKFFGRQSELPRLIQKLQQREHAAVVGPAGLGKTALAAEAIRGVVGEDETSIRNSPFPDGVVLLDLYQHKAQSDAVWNVLANAFLGVSLADRPPKVRAQHACSTRRALIVIEGAEEADGKDGRAKLVDLLAVLCPTNRYLILTRELTQVSMAEVVRLDNELSPDDALALLNSITDGQLSQEIRGRLLDLLGGHPLALTWAGGILARGDEDPFRLVEDWEKERLPPLADPTNAEHTLKWLYDRSVRGLNHIEQVALRTAGLLGHYPFPLAAIEAVISTEDATTALRRLVQAGLLRRTADVDHWTFTHGLAYQFARHDTDSDPTLRERLGNWLYEYLIMALANDADDSNVDIAFFHAGALLKCDYDQHLWQPLVNGMLEIIPEHLKRLGRLEMAALTLRGVLDWLERFSLDKPTESAWQHKRFLAYMRLGDIQSIQGSQAEAQTSYIKAVEIIEVLIAANRGR